ncbi:MAG: MlaD family protein [Terrimicrobiaceae bacterium]
MQIHKNEIATGILVLVTFGFLAAILVVIGMPGVIKPLITYRIYYDNANGIRPGAPVLLAGREIGKVTTLNSPVPAGERPEGHPDYEVSIDVRVDKDAQIYRKVTVHLTQQGLMGQQVIDFVQGDATSGIAEDGTKFSGERVPDISEAVADNMERLTGPGSDLAVTVTNAKTFMETLNKSQLPKVIENAEQLTDTLNENMKQLTGKESDLAETIRNAKTFMETLNGSRVGKVIENTEQFTDTIKREPWRILWPNTKSYAGDEKEKQLPNKKQPRTKNQTDRGRTGK